MWIGFSGFWRTFVKDDDVIPDYRSDGFADDQQEVHAALIEFTPLLQAFKGWRLRHQVPVLWTN